MALLPNVDSAAIPPEKMDEYLLNDDHPVGGAKAAFFKSFGFKIAESAVLAAALLEHARVNPVVKLQQSTYGEKFEISGPLSCPDGRMPNVKSVWIIDAGEMAPRFVTAFPD